MKDSELIEHLGGPTKVAELLKFDMPGGVQRVQNWLKRGIPAQVKIDYPAIFLAEIHVAKGFLPNGRGLSEPTPADIPSADPELNCAMAEAAQAGLIERRIFVRRADDRARLAAAGQGG